MAFAFYFDMTRCVGCRACQLACKDKNRLGVGMTWRRVRTCETGSFPKVAMYSYASACNHCSRPACAAVCPTGAMHRAEDGTVLHDDAACIGCRACMEACPYGVPQFDGIRGIVRKCDACADLRAEGLHPACVDACPCRALDFGDRDELLRRYGPDLVSDIAILPSSGLTGPNVLIRAKPCALETDFRELPL